MNAAEATHWMLSFTFQKLVEDDQENGKAPNFETKDILKKGI